MLTIINALAPVFALMALGYGLRCVKFAGEDVWHALDHITFYVLFPAILVRTLARANFEGVSAGNFVVVGIASVFIMGLLLLAYRQGHKSGMSGPVFTSVFQGVVRFQSPMTVALSQILLGNESLPFAALSVASLIPSVQLFTVTVLLLYGEGQQKPTAWTIIKGILINPLMLACIIGFILNRTGLPDFAYETLTLLGTASISLTILAIGAGLNFASARQTGGLVAVTIVLRLIGMPLLVLGLSNLMGITGVARVVAVMAAGVPTATTSYTMARKMGGDADLMAHIITFQCVASAVTLPVFIYIAQNW